MSNRIKSWITTGALSPHKWAGFAGAALVFVALQLLLIGMVGDMLNRHRVYLEELLYSSRARHGDASRAARAPVDPAPKTPRTGG